MTPAPRKPAFAVPGVLLFLAGLLVPSAVIIGTLQGADAVSNVTLMRGAGLLRAGLAVLGLWWILLYFLPSRTAELPPDPSPEPGAGHYLIVAGLIVLAALLRLYNLGNGIWYDEMLTHVRYMDLSPGQIVSSFDDANNHVLFTLAARLSIMAFGDSDWAFRLPAALFGIASVGALYIFARQVSTPLVALFSVALVTVSFHHIWFSQNARGYTALLFFSIVSSSFLLAALRSNRPLLWVMFALTGALGALTHLSIGFLCIAQFLVYAGTEFRERRDGWWTGMMFGFVPLALLTFLAYALVLPQIFGGTLLGSGLQDKRLDWLNPLWALMEIVNAFRVGFAGTIAGLVAAVVVGVGLIHFLIRRPALVVLFVVPCGLGFAMMTAIGYTLFPRFFFFAMGFAVVILIGGAVVLARFAAGLVGLKGQRSNWLPVALCLTIVAASAASLQHVYAPKQPYQRAIAYIESNLQPGDVVVALGIADFPFNTYYRLGWETAKTVDELDAIRAQTKRTWVVYTMRVHAQTVYADVLKVLETDYEPPKSFVGTLNGGGIFVQVERLPKGG